MAVFTAINFLAVRLFARVNNVITWWKVAIPVLTIIILFSKFHPGNFNPGGGGFMPVRLQGHVRRHPRRRHRVLLPRLRAGRPARGRDQEPGAQPAARDHHRGPARHRDLLLLQVVFIGATPSSVLHHGFQGIPSTNPMLIYPFAAVAGLAGLGFWATILHIDAFVSPFGTGLIYQTSTSRVGYGLARNRYYPQPFQWTDRNGVPWFSLIMAFVFGLFFLLPFPSWKSLVSLVTGASVLMYAGAPLSLAAFRRQVPEAIRPYRVPAAAVLAPLGFVIANLLIYWSGFEAVWKLGVCLVIGYVLIGIFMVFDPQRPPLDWKSAQWLPVYLIGMGIISWQGQYPLNGAGGAPPINTFHIPFWWDFLVVAGFSLIIYYWALATSLPREETLHAHRQAERAWTNLPDTGLHH